MKSPTIKPFSNGSLRVKFEELSKNLIVLSKAIEPRDWDSPEQHVLGTAISQLQDLESHYEQLSDIDTAKWMVKEKERLNKTISPILEPFSNERLHSSLQIQCNRLEVAINSLATTHRNIPEVDVLRDVVNDLDDMESHYSKIEEQQVSNSIEGES